MELGPVPMMDDHPKNSRDLFKTIFENLNDALLFLNRDGKVALANAKVYSYLDKDMSLEGRRISELGIFDEETIASLQEFFRCSLANGGMEKEFEVRFSKGYKKWVRISSVVVEDDNENKEGVILNISDISKLKRYAEVIRESQKKYKLVVENLHEGLILVDGNENIIFANQALCGMLGYRRNEVIGMNIAELVPREEFDSISNMTGRRMKGLSDNYSTWIRTRTKQTKRIKVFAAPWFDEKGNYRGSVGLLLDITDRIIHENALKESEEKYRATVQQSADNIYIYDIEEDMVVESNPALQKLLGYSADELYGMRAGEFVYHDKENIRGKIRDVVASGRAVVGERKYRRKDGSLVDVDVSATLITQGSKTNLCVVSRDITERKRYQKQLIRERNRAEFYLDLLAHDMGNLLHGIKNGMEAYRLVKDPVKKNKSLALVNELADRSITLSSDILKFSRIRDSDIESEPIKLREMLASAYRKAASCFPDCNYEIPMKVGSDYFVLAENMLEEAFFNLFHNSLKAQEGRDPVIGVKASSKGDNVLIEICDHGGGISDDMKPIIFDRFRENEIMKLSGIGMTMIKMIIQRYGGSISVEDLKHDDRLLGSRFKIRLPGGRM